MEFVQISSSGACLEAGSDRKERPEDPDSRFNKEEKGFFSDLSSVIERRTEGQG